MKKLLFFLLVFLLPSGLGATTYLGNGATIPSLPDSTVHPFLFFNYSDRDDIKAKKDSTAYFQDWYDWVIADAQGGTGSSDMVAAAFACIMTDSSGKYLARARDYIFKFTPSYVNGLPKDNDGTSRECRNLAVAYDFVYRYATTADQDSMSGCLRRMLEKVRGELNKTGDGIQWPWFFTNGNSSWINNHDFGFAGNVGLLAMALNTEYAGADTMLEFATMWLDSTMSYYVRNAPYHEGPQYGDVLMNNGLAHFLAAYKYACGIDPFADDDVELQQMVHHTLVTQRNPDGKYYGSRMATVDATTTHDYDDISGSKESLTWWRSLAASLTSDSLKQDCAWALGDPVSDSLVVETADRWRFFLPYILWDHTVSFSTAPTMNATQLMSGNDEVVFRKDWTSTSSLAHAYGRRVITGNKGTSDVMGFSIYAHGARLSVPLSTFQGDSVLYISSTNLGFPRAYNNIIPDGKPNKPAKETSGLIDALTKKSGRTPPTGSNTDSTSLDGFIATDFLDGAFMQATNVFYEPDDSDSFGVRFNNNDNFYKPDSSSDVTFNRTFLYVKDMTLTPDNEYLIVADAITTPTNYNYDYVFHHVGSVTVQGDTLSIGMNPDTADSVRLYAFWATPNNGTLTFRSNNTLTGDHVYYEVPATDSVQYLVAYYPRKKTMDVPAFVRIDSVNAKGFQVAVTEGANTVKDICFWQYNGNQTPYHGFDSDGELVLRRTVDDSIYYVYAKDATYIINEGDTLVSGDSTMTVVGLRFHEKVDGQKLVDGKVILRNPGAIVRFYQPDGTYIDTDTLNGSSNTVSMAYGDAKPPDSVTGLTTEGVGFDSIAVVWNKVDSTDCAGYNIRWSSTSQPATVTDGTGDVTNARTDTTYVIRNLLEATTYYISVFARDEIPNYSTLVSGSKDTVTTTDQPKVTTVIISDRGGADYSGRTYDTYIKNAAPASNYSGEVQFYVKTNVSGNNLSWPYVRVDLSSIFPARTVVDSARLQVYVQEYGETEYVYLYNDTTSWVDSVAVWPAPNPYFTDNFESGGLSNWTGQGGSGATVIVTASAARYGVYGLNIWSTASGQTRYTYKNLSPNLPSSCYAEGWVRFNQSGFSGSGAIQSLLEINENVVWPYGILSVNANIDATLGPQVQLYINDTNDNEYWGALQNVSWDSWFHIKLRATGLSTSNTNLYLYIDDVLVDSLTNKNTSGYSSNHRLFVGPWWAQSSLNKYSIDFDNVVYYVDSWNTAVSKLDSVYVTGTGMYNFDVTTEVQNAVDGNTLPLNFLNLTLRDQVASVNWQGMASVENAVAGNRPELTVYYHQSNLTTSQVVDMLVGEQPKIRITPH